MKIPNLGCSIQGRYKIIVLSKGIIVEERPWANNMILNQGKNLIMSGANSITAVTSYCAVGTGSATVLATDVGLTAEATAVRTNTYLTGTGNCGTSYVGQTQTNRRTYDFAVEVSNQNYSELGWSPSSTKTTNLFSKTLISGGTVTVLAGQQLRVVYDLQLVITPTGVQVGNLTVAGWGAVAGTYFYQTTYLFDSIQPSGTAMGLIGFFEPFQTSICCQAYNGTPSFSSMWGSLVGVSPIASLLNGSWSTYVTNSFSRTAVFPYWSAASWSSTAVRMFSYGPSSLGYNQFAFIFTSPQTKLNTYRLRPNGYTISIT